MPPLTPGGTSAVAGRYGLVVSVEAQASLVGSRVLEAGGNAVDAAVATAYALAVTHPSAGNLGGGGFLLFSRPGQPIVAIDFRERSPSAFRRDHFEAILAQGAKGPAASAVPGTVAGLNLAQRRFGRLSLKQVIAPAVALARGGHRVSERTGLTLRSSWMDLKRDRAARKTFGARGRPLRAGTWLVRADLAGTLERIAEADDAGFYQGETARAIVRAMRALGAPGSRPQGLISERDLGEYAPLEKAPIEFRYRGYTVATAPSAGGLITAQLLLALERSEAHRLAAGSLEELHLFAELSRRAHADRRFRPDSADPEAPAAWTESLARFALLELSPPVDPHRATPSRRWFRGALAPERESEHTTHLSVVDAEGNAVSCTTTLSASFGARYVVPGTGVVMNNSLAGFSKGDENAPRPGRRIQSFMSPTLVLHGGRVVAVLGSPGGDTIPSTVVQVLRNLIDRALPIDAAIEAPRVHHGFLPDALRVEQARPLDEQVLATLEALGHDLHLRMPAMGAANNLVVVDGVAYGHADSREGGLAVGPASPGGSTQRSDAGGVDSVGKGAL